MNTDALLTRDLILGVTLGSDIGNLPGMVAMSKFNGATGLPVTFNATDFFGSWRVYLQQVDAKLASSAIQIGAVTFTSAGAVATATLNNGSASTSFMPAPTSGFAINANGSVTGTLVAVGVSTTADRYTILGNMRNAKDVITGVLTANTSGRTRVAYGLVTMVRDVTLFNLAQSAYSVTEGGKATVTVLRTGNMAGTVTVPWSATTNTNLLVPPTSGVLTFGPNVGSQTFSVTSVADTTVEANRSVTLALGSPNGTSALLGTIPGATLTIVDDDRAGTVKLSASNYPVSETAKTAAITLLRSGTSLASNVVVQFSVTAGTAVAGRDYTPPANSSVTFAAGATTQTVLIPILDNTYVDGTRTFTFALGNVSAGGAVGSPASATVTISDNEIGGTLQFSTATPSVLEGNVSTITVTRTGGTASGVLVDFATADGTAVAGQNYTANSNTLTFNAGNTSATFQVATVNDGLITGDNTVLLTLSNPRSSAPFVGPGASVPVLGAIKSAVLTIKDLQKGVQFSSSNYSVSETAGTATVSVVRTGPLTDTATVRFSTADGSAVANTNYVPASGVLTFAPNATTQTFQVKILPDKVVSGPKTVLLLLSGANSSASPVVALGPRRSAALTITSTDVGGTVKMAAPTMSVSEAAGAVVVIISRTGGAAGGLSVDYATCDASTTNGSCTGTAQAGIDYQTATGTVTFGPGDTAKTIQVVVNNNPVVSGARTFTVGLGNVRGGATLGAPSQTLVTITDANQGGVVQLGAATFTATEPGSGNTSINLTLTRTGTNLADGASVIVLTGAGTAAPGVNYVPLASTVVFNGTATSTSVPLTVLADPTSMSTLTVPVMLTGAAGGATLGTPASGVVTIMRANKSFQFSAPVYSVVEGGTATMTALRAGPTTAAASVKWTATDSTNASAFGTPTTGTLSFAAGASSASFTIATLATVPSGNRSVTLTLSNPTAGYALGAPATLNIQDKDGPGSFQFASPTYSVAEGGTVTLTVNRVGGVGGSVTVPWMSNASVTTDFKPNMGSLTFGPGVASVKFSVAAVNNTVLEGTRQFAVTLGNTSFTGSLGTPSTAIVSVLDNENGGVIQFVNATQTVAETVPGGMVNLMLTRAGTNLAGGILVDYTITGDTLGIASGNSSVTFAASATTASIPVMIVNSLAAQPDRQLLVTLSNPRSNNSVSGPAAPTLGTLSATALTITDSLPHVEFTAPAFSVLEGQPATIGVMRSGVGTGTVTVQYATSDGTGAGGTDYTPTSGTLTVTAGAPKTFSVPTFDDGVVAGNRTVMLTLGGATGASLGTPGTAVLTILDKETAGAAQFAQGSATVVEGSSVQVTVTRSGANLVGPVTVGWSSTDGTTATPGTDFMPTSGTLTFGPGVASQSFTLSTTSDGVATGTKTIVLALGTPTGGVVIGSPSLTTIYVLDQQQSVSFASLTASVGETTPTVSIPVVRNGVPDGTVTVQYTTVDGAAVHGLDYTATSGILTFNPGDIVKTITVPILTVNAMTRNLDRAFSVMLSSPSNASVIGGDTATVTILDFHADLMITSVSPPSGTLSGKAVAAPSTVKNVGPVAAPAFNIGVFMVRADAPDATVPGAGSLVATQSVSGLAPGASATFPTQFTIDDGFPAGQYYVSAVANFGLTIPEADTSNDGLSSGQSNPPVSFTISNNLTKFKSASAAFSQTAPPTGTRAGLGPMSAVCNAEGSVNLTGTFQINSQQGDSAQGQASLTGTLNDQPVQYVISFTGTGSDNGSVTATLNNIVFNTLTAPVLTGTGTGSLTGSLQDRTLVATLSGEITGASVGDCVFTGTLSAQAQTSFSLRTGTGRDDAGTFGFPAGSTGTPFDQTPDVTYPLFPQGAGAEFDVFFDSDYPDPSTVIFTGPPGSGISNLPSNSSQSDVGNDHGFYRAGNQRGTIPGGKWTVLYKGQPHTFTLPPFNGNASWVVVFPTAHVDADGNLASISWQYLRGNGSAFASVPSTLAGITAKVQVNNSSGDNPKSALLSPSTTSFDIVAAGFSPPQWNQVQGITFDYTDIAGNLYEQQYNKAFSIQIVPQLEHIYQSLGPGDPCSSTAGCVQRNLNVFINVPSGSVNRQPCPLPPPAMLLTAQLAPPYWVQIQNHDSANGVTNTALPYSDPTCIDYTGTTTFNNSGTPTDIFSIITDLDTAGPGDTPVSVTVGAQFDVSISTNQSHDPTAERSTTVVSVEAASATAADVIDLSGPTGFTLADAHLGRPMTISWTQPTFPVLDLFVNPNVYVSSTSAGVFCSVSMNNLDPNATQVTFTFPTTCQGQAVQQANVCVFYGGVNGETSDACWFWIAMPDLTITTVNSPPTGTVSSPIPVTATVFNSGSVDAGNFQVGFFISPTNVPGSGTMFGAVDVAGLGAGMVAGVPGPSLFIPANTPPGTYFISAVADINNTVGESNESNNGRTSSTQITIH